MQKSHVDIIMYLFCLNENYCPKKKKKIVIVKNNIAIRIAGKVSRYIDASMNRATPNIPVVETLYYASVCHLFMSRLQKVIGVHCFQYSNLGSKNLNISMYFFTYFYKSFALIVCRL